MCSNDSGDGPRVGQPPRRSRGNAACDTHPRSAPAGGYHQRARRSRSWRRAVASECRWRFGVGPGADRSAGDGSDGATRLTQRLRASPLDAFEQPVDGHGADLVDGDGPTLGETNVPRAGLGWAGTVSSTGATTARSARRWNLVSEMTYTSRRVSSPRSASQISPAEGVNAGRPSRCRRRLRRACVRRAGGASRRRQRLQPPSKTVVIRRRRAQRRQRPRARRLRRRRPETVASGGRDLHRRHICHAASMPRRRDPVGVDEASAAWDVDVIAGGSARSTSTRMVRRLPQLCLGRSNRGSLGRPWHRTCRGGPSSCRRPR